MVFSRLSRRISRPLWMLSSTKVSAGLAAAAAGAAAASGAASTAETSTARRVSAGRVGVRIGSFLFARCSRFAVASSRPVLGLEISEIRQFLNLVAPVPYLLIAELAVKIAQRGIIVHRIALDSL